MPEAEPGTGATADQRIAALCRDLTNYERDRPDRARFDLEAMRALLARDGAPVLPRFTVQVGGSKGKGTLVRYLATLARPWRVGSYTSPHVETVLERVAIDGANVDEAILVRELSSVLEYARSMDGPISFYEAMTAAAIGCFARAEVDLGVFEVGLGGRLDATTAVPVDIGALTSVELEHTELLGDTIEAIATEKSFVVRSGRPAVVALEGVALDVVARRAAEVQADLSVLGRDFHVSPRREADGALRVELRSADRGDAVVTVAGAPDYEALSAALAWRILTTLDPAFVMPERIERPAMPGCFESVEGVVLDGAHTPESTRLLAAELERRFGDRPIVLLFASAHGKRWRDALGHLLSRISTVRVTSIEGTRCEPPEEIARWLADQGVDARVSDSAGDGLSELRSLGSLVVVTGSFYLAGEVRRLLRGG